MLFLSDFLSATVEDGLLYLRVIARIALYAERFKCNNALIP